jgi:hypothetical protein
MEQKGQEYVDKFQKRYDIEKQKHIVQGAVIDADNNSIIRKSKRSDKIGAQSREGNIALEIDRPVLPITTFQMLKADLLKKVQPNEVKMKPV